jgi:hypothetical protein
VFLTHSNFPPFIWGHLYKPCLPFKRCRLSKANQKANGFVLLNGKRYLRHFGASKLSMSVHSRRHGLLMAARKAFAYKTKQDFPKADLFSYQDFPTTHLSETGFEPFYPF